LNSMPRSFIRQIMQTAKQLKPLILVRMSRTMDSCWWESDSRGLSIRYRIGTRLRSLGVTLFFSKCECCPLLKKIIGEDVWGRGELNLRCGIPYLHVDATGSLIVELQQRFRECRLCTPHLVSQPWKQ
jgi:hypothetical protein